MFSAKVKLVAQDGETLILNYGKGAPATLSGGTVSEQQLIPEQIVNKLESVKLSNWKQYVFPKAIAPKASTCFHVNLAMEDGADESPGRSILCLIPKGSSTWGAGLFEVKNRGEAVWCTGLKLGYPSCIDLKAEIID